MLLIRSGTVLVCLACTLAAQTYSVSPPAYANVEAQDFELTPFDGVFAYRYQQIDGNLTGTGRLLPGIAWRHEGSPGGSSAGASMDMQLSMADSSLAAASLTFANNYVRPPLVAFTNKRVSVPALPPGSPVPAPFAFVLPFDTPFGYTGQNDLLWEIVITQLYPSGSAPLDVASGAALRAYGGDTAIGIGCGSAGRHELRSRIFTEGRTPSIELDWEIRSPVAGAISVLLLGARDPNLTVPGLCTSLHTDALLSLGGTTNRTGGWWASAGQLPYLPHLVGATIHAQAVSVDAAQPGLPLTVSNGSRGEVPPPPPTNVKLTRLWSKVSSAPVAGALEANYGLITRYTH